MIGELSFGSKKRFLRVESSIRELSGTSFIYMM